MEVNPDGYLYILSSYEGEGTIFRIVPAFSGRLLSNQNDYRIYRIFS
jgi:hypothetical protein